MYIGSLFIHFIKRKIIRFRGIRKLTYFVILTLCLQNLCLDADADIMLPCAKNICENGGVCYVVTKNNQTEKSQVCRCKPEYAGERCEYLNPCIANTEICLNGGECVPLIVDGSPEISCNCKKGYTGKRCQTKEFPKCENNTCNGGTCSYKGTDIFCECPKNYFGSRCEYYNYCADNPCRNNGTCIVKKEGKFQCLCPPGWTGYDCSEDVDECAIGYPCLNGTCRNLPGSFECECPPDWSGNSRCSKLFDPCQPNPCKNDGHCYLDDNEKQACLCKEGFSGKFCETRAPGCTECENDGECVFEGGRFVCKCTKNFIGDRCEQHVDPCTNSTYGSVCLNGGTCFIDPKGEAGSIICHCPEGFTGKYCQTRRDFCSTGESLCANGSTCINTDGGYTCICPPYRTGVYCEISTICESHPCQNGGTCIPTGDDSFRCICPSGWSGMSCELDIDECSMGLCKYTFLGTKCENLQGAFHCLCPPGLSGTFCEEDVNECENSPCLNNGTCFNTMGSFVCQCTADWTGSLCTERAFKQTSLDSCPLKSFCALHRNDKVCDDECNNEECGFDGWDCSKFSFISSVAIDLSIEYDEFISNRNQYMKALEESMHIQLEIKRNEKNEELIIDCSKEQDAKCVRVILSLKPKCDPNFPQFCFNSTTSIVEHLEALDQSEKLPFKVKHVQSYIQDPKRYGNNVLREKIAIVVVSFVMIILFIIAIGVLLRNRTWIRTTKAFPQFFTGFVEDVLKPVTLNNETEVEIDPKKPKEFDSSITPSTSPFTSSVSIADDDVNARGPNGFTSLMAVIVQPDISEEERIIQIMELCKRGADLTLKSECSKETVLHLAIRYNRISTCKTLITLCPALVNEVDLHERTPLHIAACVDSLALLPLLIRSCKANIDAIDENGYTPLQLAIELELNDVVKELLRLGANPNFLHPKSGVSPLHCAARIDNITAISLLLGYRANIDIVNDKKETPLIMAAKEGNNRACNALLNYGANPDCISSLGDSALTYAMFQNNEALVYIIKRTMLLRAQGSATFMKMPVKSRKRKIYDSVNAALSSSSVSSSKTPKSVTSDSSYTMQTVPSTSSRQFALEPNRTTTHFAFPDGSYMMQLPTRKSNSTKDPTMSQIMYI